MAEYTFDKIKYGNDVYKIEDSTALHSIPMASSITLGGVKAGGDGIVIDSSTGIISIDDKTVPYSDDWLIIHATITAGSSSDTVTVDRTYSEINTAYQAGKGLYLIVHDKDGRTYTSIGYVALNNGTPSTIYFTWYNGEVLPYINYGELQISMRMLVGSISNNNITYTVMSTTDTLAAGGNTKYIDYAGVNGDAVTCTGEWTANNGDMLVLKFSTATNFTEYGDVTFSFGNGTTYNYIPYGNASAPTKFEANINYAFYAYLDGNDITLNYLGEFSPNGRNWYGTSSTTASTSTKVVTCLNYVKHAGDIICVNFSTANTAATPTLNIGGTGATAIYVGTSTPNSTDNVLKWSANTFVYFMYDGTYYRYITSVSAGSISPSRGANTWFGTSSTTASTTAKTSSIDNFVLTKGAIVSITFSTANTANAPTLNINSTGAKAIYYNNAATSSSNKLTWDAGETLTFVYSGEYYYFVCKSKAAVDISGKVDKAISGTGDTSGYTFRVDNTTTGVSFEAVTSTNTSPSSFITLDSMGIGIGVADNTTGSDIIISEDAIAITSNGSGGVVIQGVVTPTNNTDAANKAYVDGLVSALTNTEIDNAVAAAVTVANGNNIQY